METVTPTPVDGHKFSVIGLAVFLAMHGVAHFAGLVDSFDKARAGGQAEYLGGAWTISDPSVLRAVGVLWAGVGTVVILAAVLVLLRHRRARDVVVIATLLSLTLSVLGLWAAVVGVGVNLAVLALVAFVPRRAGLLGPA